MELNDYNEFKSPSVLGEDNERSSQSLSFPTIRLFLGISSVGLLILLCLSLLTTDAIPSMTLWILNMGGTEFLVVSTFVTAYLVVNLPLDFISGYLTPIHYGRLAILKIGPYLKGILVHGFVIGIAIVTLHGAGQIGGLPLATLALLLLLTLAVQLQLWFAMGVGLQQRRQNPVDFVTDSATIWIESSDPAFSGGIVGLPGRERIILPSKWHKVMGTDHLRYLQMRRMEAIQTGYRTWGIMLAASWILMSFLLSAYLVGFPKGGLSSALELSLLSSFFHFVGLLLLPTPSRRATLAIDQRIQKRSPMKHDLKDWLQKFSLMTDGELQRNRWIEIIFHPIPSIQNRLDQDQESYWIAWNSNRMMLYFSTFSGGLLSRAVHCNVGKPELWVMAPAD